MNLTAIPDTCLQIAAKSIETLADGGKLSLACQGRHFSIARKGEAYEVAETAQPVIAAVAAGANVKPCSGCGSPKVGAPAPPVGDVDMREYFDLVFVLNLPRRSDRLAEIRAHLAEIDWPFRQPEVFTGIDAQVCPPPPWWPANQQGAWGCMESHRHMLARALSTGAQRILILEDDFFGVPSFSTDATAFVRNAPHDWEMLYFGGQDIGRDGSRYRNEIAPGIFQVAGIERTHAYAIQGGMIRDLYQKLIISSGHCDHVMGPFQRGRKVYAPAEWLAGQRASKSDIGVESSDRLWQPPPKDWPVTLFIGSPEGAKKYREENGLHGGHNLRGETDIGIIDLMRIPMAEERRKALAGWVNMIEWEGRSKTPPRPAIIYGVPERLARSVIGERLQVVTDMPGLSTSAVNAAKAVARIISAAVTGGEVHVLDAQRTDRLALCHTCDKLASDRCVECTCFVAEKSKLATEDCPLGKWNLPLNVFWHVAAMNHWREVAAEQLDALAAAGLDAATVTFLGKKSDRKWLQTEAKKRGIGIEIDRADENVMHYETFAMLAIERWARKNEDAAALYLHTKGVSAPGHAGKANWRKLMMREVVTEWRRNLESLRAGDCVGVNWREGSDPHFCGNFWIARASYIRTLPNFAEFHASKNRTRHTCELWIGKGYKPRVVSLVHRNVDYCQREWFG